MCSAHWLVHTFGIHLEEDVSQLCGIYDVTRNIILFTLDVHVAYLPVLTRSSPTQRLVVDFMYKTDGDVCNIETFNLRATAPLY